MDCSSSCRVFAGLTLLSLAVGFALYRKWVGGGVCRSKAKLNGRTVIITGANTGIGFETAVDLAGRGARVILACRSEERGEKAAVEIQRRTGNRDVLYTHLDLASLQSVRDFAKKILDRERSIDILINNAGIALPNYKTTQDGFEAHMGVNHLGHFLLTNLLLPRMQDSPHHTRIVVISSSLYKRALEFDFSEINSSDPKRFSEYMPGMAYSTSKLANILFSRSLARRLEGSNVGVYAAHPGVIFRTEVGRSFPASFMRKVVMLIVAYVFLKTPWEGAQTTIFCAVAEELEGVPWGFYGECSEEKLVTAVAEDDEVAEKLWRVSEQMVGL